MNTTILKTTTKPIAIFLLTIFALHFFTACAQPTQSNYEGAAVGSVVGATAGALLDRGNPWRGAAIGAALGAVAGGTMAEVSKKAAYEARSSNRPVVYERQTSDGWQRVEATPRPRGNQRCILVKTFENGRVVDEELSCN